MKRAGIFAGVLGRYMAMLRKKAIIAIQTDLSPKFTANAGAPDEGPLDARGYRHAIKHPADYFMCSWCGAGPWHGSWSPTKNRSRAIGGCCSGAD